LPLFKRDKKISGEGSGLALFADVQAALKAEKALKNAGYAIKLVAPPPKLRRGCDLAVEINLVESMGIERLFREKDVPYVEIVALGEGTSELLDIVKVTDFGEWTMVKAGNMKLTFEKATGVIVNTSGGGCPDIPYMHIEMIGKKLSEAPNPKDIGFSLCATMLHRALEESLAIRQERRS
jgi:predicted metal-binding protein